MALGALISAYQEAGDAGHGGGAGLRATLPLAGRTLVEYQARLAHSAGADPVVILVERMPPTLTAALDRLNAERVPVTLARSVEEAAAAFSPEARVLLVAGGLFADAATVERVAQAGGPALLTLPDNIGLDGFERIDGASRWGGLALASGAQIGATAAMLGEWDLQSTLLRRLVQDGARQLPVAPGPAAPMLLMAGGARDLDDAERRIVAGARCARRDWVERFVTPVLEEFAVEHLMGTAVRPRWLLAGALGLTALAAFFFASGWFGAAMVALLLSVPLDSIAERLAAMRMQPLARSDLLRRALPFAGAAALAALAVRLAGHGGGWGCLVTGATALAAFYAGHVERTAAGSGLPPWLASRKGSILLGAPFAATGHWALGLVAIALYAAGSFGWLQRRVHRPDAGQD